MRTLARRLRALAGSLSAALAPAEGEGWLVGLVVVLLLLGAARHRLEPWLQGIHATATDTTQVDGALGETAVTSSDFSLTRGTIPERLADTLSAIDPARFGRVDLNRASPEELESLPRIGPVLARRIAADRELHGAYGSVEELARVSGIGPRTVEGLREEAYVVPPLPHPEPAP